MVGQLPTANAKLGRIMVREGGATPTHFYTDHC